MNALRGVGVERENKDRTLPSRREYDVPEVAALVDAA
jgi:hypothetical protein